MLLTNAHIMVFFEENSHIDIPYTTRLQLQQEEIRDVINTV